MIPWQKGLISRGAVGSLTAMTLPDTGVAYILSRARVSVGVCLCLEAYGKKLSGPGGVAGHSSKDEPCTAKFRVISFSQVLEAVWSRGCTGGSSAALRKLSNKQERPTGRPTRGGNQSLSDLLFFPSPFVLKPTRRSLICCSESCQMEVELLPSGPEVSLEG